MLVMVPLNGLSMPIGNQSARSGKNHAIFSASSVSLRQAGRFSFNLQTKEREAASLKHKDHGTHPASQVYHGKDLSL